MNEARHAIRPGPLTAPTSRVGPGRHPRLCSSPRMPKRTTRRPGGPGGSLGRLLPQPEEIALEGSTT